MRTRRAAEKWTHPRRSIYNIGLRFDECTLKRQRRAYKNLLYPTVDELVASIIIYTPAFEITCRCLDMMCAGLGGGPPQNIMLDKLGSEQWVFSRIFCRG